VCRSSCCGDCGAGGWWGGQVPCGRARESGGAKAAVLSGGGGAENFGGRRWVRVGGKTREKGGKIPEPPACTPRRQWQREKKKRCKKKKEKDEQRARAPNGKFRARLQKPPEKRRACTREGGCESKRKIAVDMCEVSQSERRPRRKTRRDWRPGVLIAESPVVRRGRAKDIQEVVIARGAGLWEEIGSCAPKGVSAEWGCRGG